MNDFQAPRLYVPLDVNFADDPKLLRAGPGPELLYVRALALCKRLVTDGDIDPVHLPRLCDGIKGDHQALVAALVREGAWLEKSPGWHVAAWGRWNMSKDDLEARRGVNAGVVANHERWHVRRGVLAPGCPLCHPSTDSDGVQSASQVKGREGKGSNPYGGQPLEMTLDDAPAADPVETVWTLWQTEMDRPRTKLDPKRRRRIEWALAEYPLDDVLDAVRGHAASPYHRGENDAKRQWTDVTLTCRDADHLEGFRDAWRNRAAPVEDPNVRIVDGRMQRFYPGTGWVDAP